MGLGILEDHHLHPVPGTATLDDLEGKRVSVQHLGKVIKRNKDGIILIPQPTDDPDDPLNWPLWQRDLITFILCLMSVLAGTMSPILVADTLVLIEWFGGLSITQAALLTGYHLLGTGLSGFVFVATARVWGKRSLFVFAPLLMVASCVWAGKAGHHYGSFVGARVVQGFALAPFEGLLNAAVGELYFVHESGKRLALSSMCLFGGPFFTPIVVGKITLSLGWQWSFFLLAIFVGAVWPFIFFLCPETAYPRKLDDGTESTTHLHPSGNEAENSVPDVTQGTQPSVDQIEKQPNLTSATEKQSSTDSDETMPHPGMTVHQPVRRKLISRKGMRLFTGRKTQESFWKICFRPFPLFLHPAFLWACITQASMIAWTAFLGVSLALILLGFGFNVAQTGYMYTGAFVGAFVAFTSAGIVADPVARWLSRRNNGIFEPEFRLFMVIPILLIGVPGLFAFGQVASEPKRYGYVAIDAFMAFIVGGLTWGAIVSAQYIVDGYRGLAIEGFTCLLICKNILTYVLTLKGFTWEQKGGTRHIFFCFGYTQLAICLSAVPLYIFGKRLRSLSARYDILRYLRLR